MPTVRIATVKATGRFYVLCQLDFRDQLAFCRGEVTRTEGLRTWHAADQQLPLADVEISTVQLTVELVNRMFAQAAAAAIQAMRPGESLRVCGAVAQETRNAVYEAIGGQAGYGARFNRRSVRVTR
jgi:hypothetical protein